MISLRDQERRPPPDPDGPSGPPPTFDATPLQRERERMMARIDLLSGPRDAAPAERAAPKAAITIDVPKARVATEGPKDVAAPDRPKDVSAADRLKDVAATDGPKDVDAPDRPKAETVEDAPKPRPDPDAKAAERLETEVAEVRRIAEPEAARGLDMVI